MRLTNEKFSDLFDSYQRSAFRLEVLQTYTIPDEQPHLQAFLAGQAMPAGHNADWHQEVAANIAAGKTIQRAKVMNRPLTDYLRYQCAWSIPGNIAAGEDYQIIDTTDVSLAELGLPEQDFWLFDQEKVVQLNYEPDGSFTHAEIVDDPDLNQYLRWRDIALKHGISFNEWNVGA